MTNKDKNKKVDEAWNRLYNRFEQEELLVENKQTSFPNIFQPRIFGWAASLALVCICLVIAFKFYKANVSDQREMVTLNNTDNAVNLVTTLDDGSVVYLANQALLSYPRQFEINKREVYLEGDAFFDIHKNAEKPFIIETNLITIEVLGTAFNVKSKDNKPFSLSVLKGKVRVTLKETGNSTYIEAGETVSLNEKNWKKTTTSDFNQFADYVNKIYFKDQRLVDIVNIINNNSNDIRIKLSPELNDRLLTVTFLGESTSDMAQLISLALNLQYKQDENTILISEPK